MEMLGDGLVATPARTVMRAIDIAAAPEEVWPWLAQMLRGGGVYGWPVLETTKCSSADYLLTGLPEIGVGDRVGDVFEIARVDAPREIVWHAPGGLSLLAFGIPAMTLDYLLQPVRGQGSRLVVRMHCCCEQVTSQIRAYLCDVVDFLLPAPQLMTLRECVETYERRLGVGDIKRDRVTRHQAAPFLAAPGPRVDPAGKAAGHAYSGTRSESP
jgi:hypothetical protein